MDIMKISKLINILISVFSALLLAGCSTTDIENTIGMDNAMSTTSTKYVAANPNKVKLYYSSSVTPKHYKIIGRASVNNYSFFGVSYSQQTIAEALRKQAASIGGNGIININTGLEQTTGDVILN